MKRLKSRPQPPKDPKPSTVRTEPLPRRLQPPKPRTRAPHPRLPARLKPLRPRPQQIARIIGDDGASLVDLIDNLLSKGVMLNADIILALADVDLIYVRLSALLCTADRVMPQLRRIAKREGG